MRFNMGELDVMEKRAQFMEETETDVNIKRAAMELHLSILKLSCLLINEKLDEIKKGDSNAKVCP